MTARQGTQSAVGSQQSAEGNLSNEQRASRRRVPLSLWGRGQGRGGSKPEPGTRNAKRETRNSEPSTLNPQRPQVLAVAALLVVTACGAPRGDAAESLVTEIRLALDRGKGDPKKEREPDLKAVEQVLKKRLTIFAAQGGSVEVRKPDEIVLRVPVEKVGQNQLRILCRAGSLQIQPLDDVATNFNPDGRYLLDSLSIQGKTTLRFRDRRSNLPISAPEFLSRCPRLLENKDLQPDSARVVGSGLSLAVRLQFTDQAAKRLTRFTRKPGHLLATVLDGEMVGINASTGPVKGGKKQQPADDLGQIEVTGGFGTEEEAGYLATVFNSGPLPFPLTVLSQKLAADDEGQKKKGD